MTLGCYICLTFLVTFALILKAIYALKYANFMPITAGIFAKELKTMK